MLGGEGRCKELLIAQRVSLGYICLRCRRWNLGHSFLTRLDSLILRLERLNLPLELIELSVLLEDFQVQLLSLFIFHAHLRLESVQLKVKL